jgi:hypothetical protein
MLVGGLLTIPVNGFAAYFSGLPLFFPSLSPTVVPSLDSLCPSRVARATPYPSNSSRPR